MVDKEHMISKFTRSIKIYAFVIAYGHLLLFVTLFPLTSLILFCISVPIAYIIFVFCLIDYLHRCSTFEVLNDSMLVTATSNTNEMFLMPDMHHYVMDSPLDIDYDIGIH